MCRGIQIGNKHEQKRLLSDLFSCQVIWQLLKQNRDIISDVSYIQYYQIKKQMQEIKSGIKKRWTPQEDQALREIKQNLKYKSWNMIAKKMTTDFGFTGRSQKQCRDRYQNYLKGREQGFSWSQEEQKKMFKLFGQQGSRWELISSYFTNIKGIHIKNKFYTRVRKAVRQVNSVIEFYFAKKFSPFEFTIISKLVALISRHVEEMKYETNSAIAEKFNENGEHLHTMILYELIELTNQSGCQLFPELGLGANPQGEKKKLFKKLIKRLKVIQNEYQEWNCNLIHPLNPTFPVQNLSKIQNPNEMIKQQHQYLENEQNSNQIYCEYKYISNQHERQRAFYPIISKIKKLKLSSQRYHKSFQKDAQLQIQQQEQQEKVSYQNCHGDIQQNITPQVVQCSQIYLLNSQPTIYFPNTIDLENIQFFYHYQ